MTQDNFHLEKSIPAKSSRLSSSGSDINGPYVQDYRKKNKISQKQFWIRFGVTQSRGSRFELGAHIPEPVLILLKLYFEKRISDEDLASVSKRNLFKSGPPELIRWPVVVGG